MSGLVERDRAMCFAVGAVLFSLWEHMKRRSEDLATRRERVESAMVAVFRLFYLFGVDCDRGAWRPGQWLFHALEGTGAPRAAGVTLGPILETLYSDAAFHNRSDQLCLLQIFAALRACFELFQTSPEGIAVAPVLYRVCDRDFVQPLDGERYIVVAKWVNKKAVCNLIYLTLLRVGVCTCEMGIRASVPAIFDDAERAHLTAETGTLAINRDFYSAAPYFNSLRTLWIRINCVCHLNLDDSDRVKAYALRTQVKHALEYCGFAPIYIDDARVSLRFPWVTCVDNEFYRRLVVMPWHLAKYCPEAGAGPASASTDAPASP